MIEIVKKIWFLFHRIGMYIIPFLWIYNPNFLFLYWIITISWKLNNNNCIITQFEYYLFGETFLGKGPKYHVPFNHRLILYINLLVGGLYYLK